MKMSVRAIRLFVIVLILTICWSVESNSACAETRAVTIQPAQRTITGPKQANSPPVQASAQNATGEKPEAEKETPEQKKLKLLLAAKFDRTAPAVLKAWSYQDPVEEAKKDDSPQRWSGKIVNAYETFGT